MHSSSSASSSSSKISISSLFQYTVLAALAYVLAGAPLSSLFSSPSSTLKNSNTARAGVGQSNNNGQELENLVIPEKGLECGGHRFKGVYVMSREPLVVYIEGFLGEGEGDEIVKLR